MGETLSGTKWELRYYASVSGGMPPLKLTATVSGPKIVAGILEIRNRETGESGVFTFGGGGYGLGFGIASANLPPSWIPFETVKPIDLGEFQGFAYHANMSAGLGIGVAPISILRFSGIEIKQDNIWEKVWLGNGVSIGSFGHGFTPIAGTGLDVSYSIGALHLINHDPGQAPAATGVPNEISLGIHSILGCDGLMSVDPSVLPHDGSAGTATSDGSHIVPGDANFNDANQDPITVADPSQHSIETDGPSSSGSVADPHIGADGLTSVPDPSAAPPTGGDGLPSHGPVADPHVGADGLTSVPDPSAAPPAGGDGPSTPNPGAEINTGNIQSGADTGPAVCE